MSETETVLTEESTNKAFSADGTEILFFSIGDKTYGIEIQYIKEIISIEDITVIPKIPTYIKGVINLRGKIVPVISIRKRFSLEEIPYDDRTCIIVLEFESGEQVGVIVDRVQEVITADNNIISKTPDSHNVNINHYIKNIINFEDEIKLLLDCHKLVATDQ